MADIKLGKEIYETVRILDCKDNVLAEFSFNPSDTNIVGRYAEFVKGFEDIDRRIEEYEKINEDRSRFEKAKEKVSEIDSLIFDKINHLLNADAAKDIFSVMGPLTPTPYGYYVVFIVEKIGETINKVTGQRVQKIESKISKHTAKYNRKS